jgi:outer membrane protein assembly factor BamB
MTKQAISDEPIQQKPLRLWPGVIIVILQWLTRFGVPIIWPEGVMFFIFGGMAGTLAVVVWWAFFSRAPGIERWGGVVLMIVALIVTWPLLHKSMRLMPLVAYIIPVISLVFVAWAVASRHLSNRLRRVTMVAAVLIACGVWNLFQTGGVTGGEFRSDFAWRWSETSEDRLLAQTGKESMALPSNLAVVESEAKWPGFRGASRDGIIHGVQIKTDWSVSPPVELWRRQVGPGWSSFAVYGDLLYTQEQRGEDEVVSCYNMTTGEPVWRHQDATRFWESNSGAGPRGTPTLTKEGRIYTLGATGIMNVLDTRNGSVVWSRNAALDTDTKVPTWGFSSSPLVVDDMVIVALAGSLIAYDLSTGEPRWINPAGGDCYSSPHLLHIDGIMQVLLQNEAGASGVTPADGAMLWEHSWSGHPIVQPAQIAGGDILLSADERSGIRRIAVANGPDGWTVEERWTSKRLKPYFNDSVVYNGHAYGFDGPKLACIDIEDGTRKWRGGRYGRGQFVLLADQNLLLVLSEKGELALVEAVADQFTELARFPAIKGKTWNHPVLVDDILLVRNAQEMAAFRLSLASRPSI